MTEYKKKPVSCTEMAEFKLGLSACYGQGFPKRSGTLLEQFVEKYPASPIRKEAYSYLVIHYYPGRTTKEATNAFFNKLFAEYPDEPSFRLDYASSAVYEEDKDFLDRAIEVIEEVEPIGTSYFVKTKAELYAKKGDLSRAEGVFGSEYADNFVAGTVSVLTDYAAFWIQQKTNLEDAEKKLLMAIHIDPLDSSARQTLAGYYLNESKTDRALAVYGPEYVKTKGVGAYAQTGYARFWISKKQNMDSAAEALELSLNPESKTDNTLDRYAVEQAASLFHQLGKADRALEIYGPEYIQPRMNDPIALSSYARFWATKKTNLDSALAASEKAVTLRELSDLNRGYHWITLAQVFQALGRLEDAKKAAETAIEKCGGFNEDYYKTQLKKIQDEIDKKK